jgi:hypothetical protein
MKRDYLVLVMLLLASFVSLAQEGTGGNDPRVDENANACNAGGEMEGKCNIDFDGNGTVDQYEIDWAWECGWYIIRYDAGMISEVPERCQSLVEAELICYNSPYFYSLQYSGNPNEAGNLTLIFAPDCGGTASATLNNSVLIFASSLDEAYAICATFGTVVGVGLMTEFGWDGPEGIYGCDFT